MPPGSLDSPAQALTMLPNLASITKPPLERYGRHPLKKKRAFSYWTHLLSVLSMCSNHKNSRGKKIDSLTNILVTATTYVSLYLKDAGEQPRS